jgi:hypothetical protein
MAKRGLVLVASALAAILSAKATGHCEGLGFFDH